VAEQRTAGPRNYQAAAKQTIDQTVQVNRMTPEEARQAEQDAETLDDQEPDQTPLGRAADRPAAEEGALPPWVEVPTDLVFPRGKQVGFMRFKAEWTDRPELGDRNIIIWGLTDNDEKLAISAARGEGGRTVPEMAKRIIRSIDGHRADWTGKKSGPGGVDRFWNEIGPKCRTLVTNMYWKTHQLSMEETADFLLHCVVFRSAVAG
jgi:hypothetical protein